MIASCYQQYVRGGGTHSARRYLFPDLYLHGAASEAVKIPRFSFDYFEYGPLIEHYRALFGAANVHVFAYEAFHADPASFLEQFAERLELEVAGEQADARRENQSYPLPLLRLARGLNLFTSRTVADKRHIAHIPYWYTIRGALLERLNSSGLFGRAPSRAAAGARDHPLD